MEGATRLKLRIIARDLVKLMGDPELTDTEHARMHRAYRSIILILASEK